MPLYEFECQACGSADDFVATVDDRRNTPKCVACGGKTNLVISACAGVVKFPAAGGREYISPASGKHITTERARLDDLKRTGCRVYEGREQEQKEVDRQKAYAEKKSDAKLHDNVSSAYHKLSPKQKKVLNS